MLVIGIESVGIKRRLIQRQIVFRAIKKGFLRKAPLFLANQHQINFPSVKTFKYQIEINVQEFQFSHKRKRRLLELKICIVKRKYPKALFFN